MDRFFLDTDHKIDIIKAMNKQKNSIESHLISLSEHSKSIAEYINNSPVLMDDDLYTWFRIAGSIISIDYEGIDYRGYYWDKAILNYEEENNELYAELVKEATVFMYLYNGLENLIKQFKIPENKQYKGRINTAAIFIAQHFRDKPQWIPLYNDMMNNCAEMYCKSIDESYELSKEYNNSIDINGIGLKFIYRLRNRLMHGDFLFPEPDDYTKYPFHTQIINSCSRLLLMSVQLLLIASLGNTSTSNIFDIYTPTYRDVPDDFIIDEISYLRNIHLDNMECPTVLT